MKAADCVDAGAGAYSCNLTSPTGEEVTVMFEVENPTGRVEVYGGSGARQASAPPTTNTTTRPATPQVPSAYRVTAFSVDPGQTDTEYAQQVQTDLQGQTGVLNADCTPDAGGLPGLLGVACTFTDTEGYLTTMAYLVNPTSAIVYGYVVSVSAVS